MAYRILTLLALLHIVKKCSQRPPQTKENLQDSSLNAELREGSLATRKHLLFRYEMAAV